MLITTALDPVIARAIMRKAGLISGTEAGGGDGDGTLLLDQLLTPPLAHRRPQRPRRRVQNSFTFPFPWDLAEGNTFWDERTNDNTVPTGDTTMLRLQDMQKRFNEMWFPGFSDHERPPLGAYLVNPEFTTFGLPLRAGKCWVGGASAYDPFPYPGAPYYLWADLAEAGIAPYIDGVDVGFADSPLETPTSSGEAVGPIILKCYGSLDGGDTWDAPWPPLTGAGVANAGAAYFARNLNPDYTPATGEDGAGVPLVGMLRQEFRYDDVLFKFTLTTDPGNWIEFENLGIRIEGNYG